MFGGTEQSSWGETKVSNPPQQPGPYGPSPRLPQGPQGPQGPYGPPSGGFPQPGPGYPRAGRQPNQQTSYGPPGAFPQQGGFDQQGGYGQPPGGFGGYLGGGIPPRKKSAGLIIGLGIGAALAVVAVLITGLAAPGWMLGDDARASGGAKRTAQAVVDAVNAGDEQRAMSKLCEQNEAAPYIRAAINLHARLTLGDVSENGATATTSVVIKLTGTPDQNYDVEMKKNTDWCLSKIAQSSAGGSSGGYSGSGGY